MEHRNNIKLSERLAMSAGMVTAGSSVADVGCDHAHTCIWLVKHGGAPKAVAMDVRPGPLSHAEANIRLYGLNEIIKTRLSDGLDALEPGETDTIIIGGMGGTLTVQILENGLDKAKAARELILQPQSDLGMVRRFLREHGFRILEEKMCKEFGKFYTSMKAVYEEQQRESEDNFLQSVYDEFGECLLADRNEILYEVLLILKGKNQRILDKISEEGSEESIERRAFFENEKELIQTALRFYDV